MEPPAEKPSEDGWQAAPGCEAPRRGVGERVARTWKAVPWWAKLLPAVVGAFIVITLYAGDVFGNVLNQGGFSDTETMTMTFQAAAWEDGDKDGDGDCNRGGHGGHGGHGDNGGNGRNGHHGANGLGGTGADASGNESDKGENACENVAGEDRHGAGNGGGCMYDGAAENAALAGCEGGSGSGGGGS